jgi:dolichol-phosphate mannosyltransferase
MMAARPLISIVTPCYNEEENVHLHFQRVRAAIEPLRAKYDFEHIYTDNCSTDTTFELLRELGAKDPAVRAMRFSRNIGPNRAIALGLRAANELRFSDGAEAGPWARATASKSGTE